MNLGQFRLRISKLAPDVDPELRDAFIQDRYTQLLDLLPWKRRESEFTIQAPTSYATGTITATQGSTTIAGDGTAWTADMNGLAIRIASQSEYYELTVTNGTEAELDRPYEAASDTDLAYRIDQPVFVLPSNCRIVRQVTPFHDRLRALELVTPAELDRLAGNREEYGVPRYAAPTWDNFSDPPRMQLELYPIPQSPNTAGAIPSWAVTCILDAADLNPSQTSTTLLPWVRPGALMAGVQADLARLTKDYQGAREFEDQFDRLAASMAQINALQRGPQEIRLAPELRRRTGRDFDDDGEDRVVIGPSI